MKTRYLFMTELNKIVAVERCQGAAEAGEVANELALKHEIGVFYFAQAGYVGLDLAKQKQYGDELCAQCGAEVEWIECPRCCRLPGPDDPNCEICHGEGPTPNCPNCTPIFSERPGGAQ